MLILSVMSFFRPLYGFIISAGACCIGLASYTPPATPKSRCAEHVQERLFFGLTGPEGAISEAEWERFIDTAVTPRFPNGLTIMQATGQWQKTDNRVVREASRVIEIVHDGSAHAARHVTDIAAEYKGRYHQESVLVTRVRVNACFR